MYIYTTGGNFSVIRKFYKVELKNITIEKRDWDNCYKITIGESKFIINTDNDISFNDIITEILNIESQYSENEYILFENFQNELQETINRIMQDRRL